MLTPERAQARARAARAHQAADLARLRRRTRGDARTRAAAALRQLASRIEPVGADVSVPSERVIRRTADVG